MALFIEANAMPPAPGPLVVGLSGGADSVALLALLCALGYRCLAVHCHFGLRGAEADRDLEHARSVAAALGAEFSSVRFDTRAEMARRGISAEMACRDLRYAHFARLMESSGAVATAVGHHAEDNAETLLLNLLRSSGLHGVRGMLPMSGTIMRPLLECTRAEILEYLQQRSLSYVTDSSNHSTDFTRNRLRLCVLPALYREFPGALAAITRSLAHLRGNEALYNGWLREQRPTLTLEQIRESAAPLTLMHELMSPLGFNSTQCADMLTAASGAEFTSPTHRAEIAHGRLVVTELGADTPLKPRLAWRRLSPQEFAPQPGRLYLDSSALLGSPQWELRPARTADRMRPYGMSRGSRLLSDIYTDARLTPGQKRAQWVLTRDGVILWAVGLRASAHFPVTPSTTEIIEIHEEI